MSVYPYKQLFSLLPPVRYCMHRSKVTVQCWCTLRTPVLGKLMQEDTSSMPASTAVCSRPAWSVINPFKNKKKCNKQQLTVAGIIMWARRKMENRVCLLNSILGMADLLPLYFCDWLKEKKNLRAIHPRDNFPK